MNKAYAGVFLLSVFLASCDTPISQPPSRLVPDSVMVEIIIEFHLLESRAELFEEDMNQKRDSVFAHYHVDQVAFEETMEYYSENPAAYLKVYSDALDQLTDERYMSND